MANKGYFIMWLIGLAMGAGGCYFWMTKAKAALVEEINRLKDEIKEQL